MKIEAIQIQKSARYVTLGSPNSKKLLLVFHGYGQLANYFIKNFEVLLEKDYFIVAPEGTHRFYLNGSSGRVGASWMTKELREQDISENIVYLEQLMQDICAKNTYEEVQILGFSQGGATATRWFANSKFSFTRFVLWACVFPEDVIADFKTTKFQETKKQFVIGKQDEYFYGENYTKILNFYAATDFEIFEFDGTHKIDLKTLLLLFK